MTTIFDNLQAVHERIASAAKACGRNADDIALLAVSKTWPATCVKQAVSAGQTAFGENYVQEGVDKIAEMDSPELAWHFIGPLQSNKTRNVAEHFDWVHSIDRLKIAQRLSEQRPDRRPPLQVCLQVNISGEDTKSGITLAEIPVLATQVARLPHMQLRGLMAIPEPIDDYEQQRQAFRRLRVAFEALKEQGLSVDTLSMGMSHDLEAAIAEGATLVRIGTAIFGERHRL
jgi:hypothetical protein